MDEDKDYADRGRKSTMIVIVFEPVLHNGCK
jgi:hypothetical protein